MTLIEAIQNEQATRKLTDTQLAKLMQIDLSTWSRIRRGICPPGTKFLKAVIAQFPGLTPQIIEYLNEKEASHANGTPRT